MKTELINKSPIYKFLLATFRANPDYFLEQLVRPSLGFSKENFASIVQSITRNDIDLKGLPHFNDEVVTSFEKIANSKWELIDDDKVSSPFEFIKRYADNILTLQKDIPYYRVNKTSTWNTLTFEMGEDLFTTTLLADNYIKHGVEPTHFQWNYILHSNFFSLNSLISRNKIIENHYHLFGSAPNVDLSWLCLMNNPFGQKEKLKSYEKGYALEQPNINTYAPFQQTGLSVLTIIAAYIRIKLFEECCTDNGNKLNLRSAINEIRNIRDNETIIYSDEMAGLISSYKYLSSYRAEGNHVVDYAIANFSRREDLDYFELAGERHLYYNCLKRIFRYDDKSFDIQVLFYLYLLIKGKFGSIFIQRNTKYGFDNFEKYQSKKFSIISKTIYEDIAIKMALSDNINENYIDKLEARITPSKSVDSFKKKIERYDRISETDKKNCFYVIHFIKNKNCDWGTDEKYQCIPVCRELKLRDDIKKQAKVIEKFRKETRDASFRVYGIDAASHEVNCRPENFGQVFRYLSASRQNYPFLHYDDSKVHLPDLRKTFHVGEDFYDIIDGLRSIDEAVLYLKLKYGDRIGHGVALGIDPEKYYSSRRVISMPRQNALDNLAWILYCIEKFKVNITTSFYALLKFSFDKYFNQLHHSISPDLFAYISAWKLRGDNPECYRSPDFKQAVKQNLSPLTDWEKYNFTKEERYKNIEENVYNLYHSYHYDFELKVAAQKIIQFEISDEYVDVVKQIQIIMRNFILTKGVAIESNPSSNFLISKLDETIELPTFKLFPIKESESDFLRLNTSINSDDQGVFYTSLVKEYTLLADALQREVNSNGLRKYSDDRILNWVKHLIDNGKEQCFMQDNLL